MRRVAGGETIFDPQVEQPSALKGERSGGLTPRELEVLQMIVDGKSNREIADELHMSTPTAKTHVSRVLMKLNARDRAQLVVIAYESGFITPG